MKITALIGNDGLNRYFENYLNVILKNQLECSFRDNEALFFVCEGYSGLNYKKEFVSGLYVALEISLERKNLVIFSSLLDRASLEAKYKDDFEKLMLRENVTLFRSLEINHKLIEVFNDFVSKLKE